jgi:hypothetical protein
LEIKKIRDIGSRSLAEQILLPVLLSPDGDSQNHRGAREHVKTVIPEERRSIRVAQLKHWVWQRIRHLRPQ